MWNKDNAKQQLRDAINEGILSMPQRLCELEEQLRIKYEAEVNEKEGTICKKRKRTPDGITADTYRALLTPTNHPPPSKVRKLEPKPSTERRKQRIGLVTPSVTPEDGESAREQVNTLAAESDITDSSNSSETSSEDDNASRQGVAVNETSDDASSAESESDHDSVTAVRKPSEGVASNASETSDQVAHNLPKERSPRNTIEDDESSSGEECDEDESSSGEESNGSMASSDSETLDHVAHRLPKATNLEAIPDEDESSSEEEIDGQESSSEEEIDGNESSSEEEDYDEGQSSSEEGDSDEDDPRNQAEARKPTPETSARAPRDPDRGGKTSSGQGSTANTQAKKRTKNAISLREQQALLGVATTQEKTETPKRQYGPANNFGYGWQYSDSPSTQHSPTPAPPFSRPQFPKKVKISTFKTNQQQSEGSNPAVVRNKSQVSEAAANKIISDALLPATAPQRPKTLLAASQAQSKSSAAASMSHRRPASAPSVPDKHAKGPSVGASQTKSGASATATSSKHSEVLHHIENIENQATSTIPGTSLTVRQCKALQRAAHQASMISSNSTPDSIHKEVMQQLANKGQSGSQALGLKKKQSKASASATVETQSESPPRSQQAYAVVVRTTKEKSGVTSNNPPASPKHSTTVVGRPATNTGDTPTMNRDNRTSTKQTPGAALHTPATIRHPPVTTESIHRSKLQPKSSQWEEALSQPAVQLDRYNTISKSYDNLLRPQLGSSGSARVLGDLEGHWDIFCPMFKQQYKPSRRLTLDIALDRETNTLWGGFDFEPFVGVLRARPIPTQATTIPIKLVCNGQHVYTQEPFCGDDCKGEMVFFAAGHLKLVIRAGNMWEAVMFGRRYDGECLLRESEDLEDGFHSYKFMKTLRRG